MTPAILVIEDDVLMRKSLAIFCKQNSLQAQLAENGAQGLDLFKKQNFDAVLLDMRLPDANGMDLLQAIQDIDEDMAVIMMTAFPDVKSAVETIKKGAFDYVVKPFEVEELRQTINRALEIRNLKSEVLRLQRELPDDYFPEILGESPAIKKVKDMIAKVAKAANTPVLITGPSGTGKELTANAVHAFSDRHEKSLVKINCSALPENLLESELFGFEKSAFTGATQHKPGLFELANGGTLFLDEISEMQINMQPKLLRVIEGHPFKRLGGTRDLSVDVRVVAASNKNLQQMVQAGTFREDLFYRLSAFVIEMPTLQERPEDVLLFVNHFLRKCSVKMRKQITGISKPAISILKKYPWPGNVRELRNIIERAVILCDDREITPEHLPVQLYPDKYTNPSPSAASENWILAEIERRHILWVLEQVGGNKSEATRRLGIARSTFDEKMKKYQRT